MHQDKPAITLKINIQTVQITICYKAAFELKYLAVFPLRLS